MYTISHICELEPFHPQYVIIFTVSCVCMYVRMYVYNYMYYFSGFVCICTCVDRRVSEIVLAALAGMVCIARALSHACDWRQWFYGQ